MYICIYMHSMYWYINLLRVQRGMQSCAAAPGGAPPPPFSREGGQAPRPAARADHFPAAGSVVPAVEAAVPEVGRENVARMIDSLISLIIN